MKYRKLGKTGMKVSVVGIGTWQYGGEWGKDFSVQEVKSILDKGKELGINLVDTAECYGDHLSESLIGESLKGQRQDWVIATKFGHKFNSFQKRDQLWSAENVREQLEASLRALQTDYVDLYQFHSGIDEYLYNDELWTMLDKQVKAGKVRHLGISIGGGYELHRQVDPATRLGAEAVQVIYNRLDRKPEESMFPSCISQDLGVLARVPLASGYLSGKYKPGAVFPENDVRAGHARETTDEKLRMVEEIKAREVPEGVNMAQWAIAWCLQHEAVSCCIPGSKDVNQLATNAAAAELDIVSYSHPQAWK